MHAPRAEKTVTMSQALQAYSVHTVVLRGLAVCVSSLCLY